MVRKFSLLLLSLVTAGVCLAEPKASFPDISQADLKTAVEHKQVVLLDCNGTDSYQKGHIPGAIDYDANSAKLAALLPKDKHALIVAYCGGPQCHAYEKGASATQALGYTNVKHFTGGLSGWMAAKLPLEK